MPARLQLTGQTFDRLTVIRFSHSDGVSFWLCRCSCPDSTEVTVRGRDLKSGHVRSCGCLQKERVIQASTSHGLASHPLYDIWLLMHSRCSNPSAKEFPRYGGRGIRVCERWSGSDGLINFIADMGEKPAPGYSLDRIQVNGDYSPENCRWATAEEQGNNRRNNQFITYKNQSLSAAQWERRVGIDASTILGRLKRGWSVEKAMTEPVRRRKA